MRRPIDLLVSGLMLLVLAGCGGTPEPPFAGTWKVTTLPAGKEIAMWLVRVEPDDGGLRGSVVAAGLPPFEGAKVEECRADGDVLHLTLAVDGRPYAFVFHRAGGEARPQQLLGSTTIRGGRDFARLERTKLTALDQAQAMVMTDPANELERAHSMAAGPAKEAALRQVIEHHGGGATEYVARVDLAEALAARGAEAEARDQAERAVALADPYGPEMKRQALAHVALVVLASGKLSAVAVDYARRAEQTLAATDPPEEQRLALALLARALGADHQEAEAKRTDERLAKVEEALDRDFEAKAVPFETPPFAGRRGKGDRAVLVELFTGAQCPPCAAADVAFDALLRTYAPRDVVLVQYHLHVPSPDPLTNHAAERRANYYGVRGTPSWFVNGGTGPTAAGPRELARQGYAALRGKLEREMESDAAARLKLSAARQGEQVTITAEADAVKSHAAARLRLVLVEEVVRYPSVLGQRLHHHVARAFPGGAGGVSLGAAPVRQEVTVNLADLRKSLRQELAERPAFKDGDWPLELKRLKVVGVVQDDQTRAVLQAAQADVPDE